jgi:AraC-like DNA-binding protein
MQKRASFKISNTLFDPLPSDADFFCDKKQIRLPYAEDFPVLHYHDRYELGICEDGEGLFLSEGKYSALSAGDIIFIAPGARHYSRSIYRDAPCRCRFFYFRTEPIRATLELHSPDLEKYEALAHRVPTVLRPSDFQRAHGLLSELVGDCKKNLEKAAPRAFLRLALFLMEAEEILGLTADESIKPKPHGAEERVAEFISLHYAEAHSASELAAMCYLSESQLRRRFMASYGQPPIAYRNSLRCRIACELLTSTELPVAEIAERVGFGNVSDFYRMFRKLHGIAPYEYKKSKA